MEGSTARARSGRTTALRVAPLAAALLLAACGGGGGGGGNTRVDPPPAFVPPPPPVVPPPTSPPPTLVQPPNPAFSGHLAVTNAYAAHAAGFTGAGIRIGIVDSGVNRRHPSLSGRVVANLAYVDPRRNNLAIDDVDGHGTTIAQVAAGTPFGQWPGGMAPGAQIVSARIISDTPPTDDGSGSGNEVDGPLGLAPVHADLIARGVRIMNNSWGGLYWTNPAATAGIASEYRDFIFRHDGLVVFATGNASRPDPSDMAALPSQPGPGGTTPAADLVRGWITVAALDADNPAVLAAYSNACGIAMHYCLVAPGTVVATGVNDAPDAPTYLRWSGTSLSTPLVSGAAALVWQAFPYFDNDLVRQTLLGTATDLGAPGVDPVFGHGRLDAGRAVRGPAALSGTVTARFDAATSRWGNRLSGPGRVVKAGSGTLVLEQFAANAGGFDVQGGLLDTVGLTGDLAIGRGARVATRGLLDGHVDNAGRLDLRASPGASGPTPIPARVLGNYLHRDDATLGIELGTPLAVGGTATLQGGDLQVLGVRSGYVTAASESVLTASGGVTGSFDALTAAPGVLLQAQLRYAPTTVWLDITRLDVTVAALSFASITPAALSSAQRVESAFRRLDDAGNGADGDGASDAATTDGFRGAAAELQRIGTQAAADAALASLSGSAHAAAATMTFDAIDMGRRALAARIDDLGADRRRSGAWARGLGGGGQGGYAGNAFATDGWLLGRDQPLGGDAVVGFAFGETRAWGAGGSDRSDDRQVQGQVYAAAVAGRGYVVGQAGIGRYDRDIARTVSTGASRYGVQARYAGGFRAASVEAGWRGALGAIDATPYLGVEYAQLIGNGFREDGAAGLGLQVRDWRASRAQAIAGLRLSGRWLGVGWGAYGEWQQLLDARGLDVAASFTGIEAWTPLPGMAPGRSGGLLGIAAERGLGNGALRLGVDQRIGPRGDDALVSLRYARGF